jgi:hypothetical protein
MSGCPACGHDGEEERKRPGAIPAFLSFGILAQLACIEGGGAANDVLGRRHVEDSEPPCHP